VKHHLSQGVRFSQESYNIFSFLKMPFIVFHWSEALMCCRIQFFGAQIVLALEYLHCINIIYRNLRPENLVIGQSGYLILVNFEVSKEVSRVPSDSVTFDGSTLREYSVQLSSAF
jgi:serine/threonine protein kinase